MLIGQPNAEEAMQILWLPPGDVADFTVMCSAQDSRPVLRVVDVQLRDDGLHPVRESQEVEEEAVGVGGGGGGVSLRVGLAVRGDVVWVYEALLKAAEEVLDP